MTEHPTAHGACCHAPQASAPAVTAAPAATHDCCHAPEAAVAPAPAPAATHDCCHGGAAVPASVAQAPLAAGAIRYVCPMCPGVESDRPGACPKCGMALELAMPSLEAGEDPELVDMRRRFWFAAALTLP